MESHADHFAIPASDLLGQRVTELDDGDRRIRIERYREVAILFVDAVVEGLVLGLVHEGGNQRTTTTSLLENLAGLIKGVSHGLIRRALAEPSEEELADLRTYLRERIHPIAWTKGSRYGVVFPVPPAVRSNLDDCIRAAHEGRGGEVREQFTESLVAFIDSGLHYYFVLPFSLLRLGRVLRTAVDVGSTTLMKASHAAARHATTSDSAVDLAVLARFLDERFVAVAA